jgi:hypothetical protein
VHCNNVSAPELPGEQKQAVEEYGAKKWKNVGTHEYVTKVHARNEGLSCSSKKTDIAPKFSMFCALHTPFHIIILMCL